MQPGRDTRDAAQRPGGEAGIDRHRWGEWMEKLLDEKRENAI